MKKLIGFIAAMLVASSVIAAPVVWIVPPTLLSDGSTVSGTFTYDTSTSTLSNINITSTGTVAGTFQFPAAAAWLPLAMVTQETAIATAGVTRIVSVNISGIPANGGTYTSTIVQNGTCFSISIGLCNSFTPGGTHATVQLSSVSAVATPVPTLSEYAMLALASLLAMFGAWQMRKRGTI
jgi:hypothetical protein